MAPAPTPLLLRMMMMMMMIGHGVSVSLEKKLAHVERYETVMPRRLPAARGRRDLSAQSSIYPDHVLYSIHAEGKDYVLHLEKNTELLGRHYTETHYSADGTEIIEKPDIQDHCFYQGHVQGYAVSAASISTCNGLSGFFHVNETVYVLEPLGEDKAGWHAVYRAAHLRMKRGTCQESSATLEYDYEPKIAAAMKLRHWKSAPLHKGPRYVELILVVDNEEFRKYKDLRMVQNRMKEIVNHVDKLYQSLHLRVALIGLEVWNNKDKITVSPNPEVTLDNFLRWRETELLKKKQHDNAQLITGIDFHGTTVGLAKKLAMCTRDSGGVSQDHSENPIGAASTMAHEMGHNLGMSHDEDIASCHCPVPKADGGCVMAASVGLVYPKLFSSCSEHDMWQFLGDPRTSCLLNAPKADELYGGPVCGNQFVERGEQCDCGAPEECSDPCCNATTCQLREGAECARGECCQDCKVKAAGALCRASKNDCDLPEHCTGLSPECPEDVFQENGIPCQHGNGYCYNGACPSHGEQCRMLWGAAAQVAPDACFNYNSAQNLYLHCLTESGKRPCSPEDVKCGTLLCLSENTHPVIGGSSYHISFNRLKCKAAITENDASGTVANLKLVPTGTKCGEEMVCYAGRCQNVLVYGNKNCSAKCNNHGVCNHKRECHCDPGWAAPYCEQRISEITTGGSTVVMAAVLAVLALSSILLGGGFVLARGGGKRFFRKGRISTSAARGLANPLFQEGGRKRPMQSQLSRDDIGSPSLLATTSNLQGARSVRPSRPAPEPPAPAAQMMSPTSPVRPSQGVTMLCLPPLPPASAKPLLAPREAKPSAPSKPLPALKNKEVAWPCCTAGEGPLLPPIPPAKPAALLSQEHPGPLMPQRGVTPKVALKPPTARR